MELVDQQTHSNIATKIRTSYNFLTRLKGLMFVRDLAGDETMHIKPCHSVHTCFMRFPIDVVYVNEQLEVVAMEETMKPYRFGKSQPRAHSVFEFKAGTIQNKGVYVGQKFLLKQEESEWHELA